MHQPSRVLIIRLGGLGDVVNTLPAVRALRQELPAAHLTWLVEEPSAALVAANPDVSEVIVLPRRRWSGMLPRPWLWPCAVSEATRLLHTLRRQGFDLLLDFQGNLKSGILARVTGVPRRIGFTPGASRECNSLFMTELVQPPSERIARVEKHLTLVRRVAPTAFYSRPEIRLSPEDEAATDDFLQRAGLAEKRIVGIHPGTSPFGAFKRWPTERYGEVAARLGERLGTTTIVTWGCGEEALAEAVVASARGHATRAPALTPTQLAALMKRMDLFIAADTGPLHLAALLNRPVVALFGPKDPAIYGPYDCPSVIVRKELPCSPCTRRRCAHVRCIMEISVNDVCAAAEQLLARSKSAQ